MSSRRRRPRNMQKVPKFLQPKHYREYLREALAEEGREAAKRPRPIDLFSLACARNEHDVCNGYAHKNYTKPGAADELEDCICHCHDSLDSR